MLFKVPLMKMNLLEMKSKARSFIFLDKIVFFLFGLSESNAE